MNRWFSALFGKQPPKVPEPEPATSPLWCLVGNLKESSNNLFRSGQKMFCTRSSRKGTFHRIRVVGRYRGSGRLIGSYIATEKIETWRAKPIYSPKLQRKLREEFVVWKSQTEVQELAEWLNSATPKELTELPEKLAGLEVS